MKKGGLTTWRKTPSETQVQVPNVEVSVWISVLQIVVCAGSAAVIIEHPIHIVAVIGGTPKIPKS